MESTRGYLNFSLVLSSCYIKSICSHLNLTHRPYTIKAVFVLLLFKIAISASCLLRRLYKIYMVWPSLLFKIYVPRHINFINGYIHFILFSYYSHLIYAISHILFTRPTERTAPGNQRIVDAPLRTNTGCQGVSIQVTTPQLDGHLWRSPRGISARLYNGIVIIIPSGRMFRIIVMACLSRTGMVS